MFYCNGIRAFILITILIGSSLIYGYQPFPNAIAQGLQLRVSAAENPAFENHFFGSQIVQIIIDDLGARDSNDSTVGLQVKGTTVPRVHLRDGLWYSFIAERAAFLLLADLLSDGSRDGVIAVQNTAGINTPSGFTVDPNKETSFIRDITITGGATFIEVDQNMLFPTLPQPFFDPANPEVELGDADPSTTDCSGATASANFNVVDGECDWPYIRLFSLIETDIVAIRAGSASVDLKFDDFPDSITSSIDRTAAYPVDAEVIVQFTDFMWNMNPVEEDVVTFVLDKDTGTPSRIIYQPLRNFGETDKIANADFLSVFTDIDFDGRQMLELDVPEGINAIKFSFKFDGTKVDRVSTSVDFTASSAKLAKEIGADEGPAIRMIESDPNTSFFESIDEAQGSRSNIFAGANDRVASWDYFDIINSSAMTQHDGFATVDKEVYNSADRAVFTVTDPDLNLRSRISETIDARESKNFFNIGNPIPIINTRTAASTPGIFDTNLNKVNRIWEAIFLQSTGDRIGVEGLFGVDLAGTFVRVDVDNDGTIEAENPAGNGDFEALQAATEDIKRINITPTSDENDFAALKFVPSGIDGDLANAIIIDTNLSIADISELAVTSRQMTVRELRDQVRIDNLEDGTADQIENFLVETARIWHDNNGNGVFDLDVDDVIGRDVDLGPDDTVNVRVDIPKYNLIQLDVNRMSFDTEPRKIVVQMQVIESDCADDDVADAFKGDNPGGTCVVGIDPDGGEGRIGATQIVDFTPFQTDASDQDGDPTTGDTWANTLIDPLTDPTSNVGYDRDPLTNKRAGIGSFRVIDLLDITNAANVDPAKTFIRFTVLFFGADDEPLETVGTTTQVLVLDILGLSILFDPPSTENAPDDVKMDNQGTFSNMIYRLEMDETGSNSSVFSAHADFMTATQFDTVADVLNLIVTTGDPVKTWLPNRFIPPNRLAFTYIDKDIVNFFRSASATFIYETVDGKITWDRDTYKFGSHAIITLEDQDLNRRPDATERYNIPVDGFIFFTLGDQRVDTDCNAGDANCFFNQIDATLLETGPNTGVFVAQITMPSRILLDTDDGTESSATQQKDLEVNYVDIRDRSSIRQEFDDITNVRTKLGQVVLDRSVYPPGPLIQAGTLLDPTPRVELVGAIMYIEIVEGALNLDPEVRDVLDLTRTVDFSSVSGDATDIRDIVEIRIFNGGSTDPVIFSANPSSSVFAGGNAFPILDRKLNQVTEAIETGPNTNTFEFEFQIYCPDINPDLFGPFLPVCTNKIFEVPVFESNSPIEVIFNDPADESGVPEDVVTSAVIQTQTAIIGSDKPEYQLGEQAIVFINEPDFNLDSRTTEIFDFNFMRITTDKTPVNELPLGLLIDALEALGEFSTQELGFRESEPNSGIFGAIVPEGAIDETVVSRGEEIELVYFDQTPSGGGREIRVEYEVLIKETLPEIIFDKEEYSPFDEVSFRIISPDSNDEPTQIQSIRVLVSTSSTGGFVLSVTETGPNTGIFEEEIKLTPNPDTFPGDLLAIREDGLSIEFRIDEDTVVTKSVFINYHVGNVMFDRDGYAITDRAVISVVDPNENKNPDTVDTLNVRVWSTTDRGGLQITLRETGDRTGIFEEFLTFATDEESTGTRLRVSVGDTITAKYTDRTLPAPAALDNEGIFTVEVEELFASALIGSTGPPIEREKVTEPELVDENGLPIEHIESNRQVLIQSEITNNQNSKQKFVYIVQVKDSDNITTSLSWISGELAGNDSIVAAQSWIPETKGEYQIEVFVWEGIDNPAALSPIRTLSIAAL